MYRNWLDEYTKINKGDGYHFERFVSDLYSTYYNVSVKLNGKSNDKGVDLIVENKIGIQAKYYSTSLGIKAIQEIHTGIAYYGLEQGIVVTNLSFNSNATDFAKQVGIKLIDGNEILLMINHLAMGKQASEEEKGKQEFNVDIKGRLLIIQKTTLNNIKQKNYIKMKLKLRSLMKK